MLKVLLVIDETLPRSYGVSKLNHDFYCDGCACFGCSGNARLSLLNFALAKSSIMPFNCARCDLVAADSLLVSTLWLHSKNETVDGSNNLKVDSNAKIGFLWLTAKLFVCMLRLVHACAPPCLMWSSEDPLDEWMPYADLLPRQIVGKQTSSHKADTF